MKKIISYSFVLGAALACTWLHADDEIKLKKSCLKDYPAVVGESNPELLSIYAQLCDKKNKERKNELLIQAASQFQKNGQNFKSLQVINELESNNIKNNTVTDIKFLAALGITDSALQYMKQQESRYLNAEDTYPAAIKFSEDVKKSIPTSIVEKKVDEAEVARKAEAKERWLRDKAAKDKAAKEKWLRDKAAKDRATKGGKTGKASGGATVTNSPAPSASSGPTPFKDL